MLSVCNAVWYTWRRSTLHHLRTVLYITCVRGVLRVLRACSLVGQLGFVVINGAMADICVECRCLYGLRDVKVFVF